MMREIGWKIFIVVLASLPALAMIAFIVAASAAGDLLRGALK